MDDSASPMVVSDSESDPDLLELKTDEDLLIDKEDGLPSTSRQQKGSVRRDIIVDDQMEGCHIPLEITSNGPHNSDVDDSNNIPTSGRLPDFDDSELETVDELADELCMNLYEPNKVVMLSVVSSIERKKILDVYKKTSFILENGGQKTKDGTRNRTPGGIFFNLIKTDKTIPSSAKRAVYGSIYSSWRGDNLSQNKHKRMKRKNKLRKKKLESVKGVDSNKTLNVPVGTGSSTKAEEHQPSET